MTLTLLQLRAALDRLSDAHPLTATNIESVDIIGTDISFSFDQSELRCDLASANEELENKEARIERLEEANENLRERIVELSK